MKVSVVLTHDEKDRSVPRRLLVPVKRAAHRPRSSFRVRIEGRADAVIARRAGLPLHFLTPEVTAAWGFPHATQGVLVLAREIAGLIDTDLAVAILESTDAARSPRLEDLVVVLLRTNPLLARALARRHRRFLDPPRLLKRVLQENVEEVATRVDLQSIVPAIPRVGTSLPEAFLQRQDRNAWVGGRL